MAAYNERFSFLDPLNKDIVNRTTRYRIARKRNRGSQEFEADTDDFNTESTASELCLVNSASPLRDNGLNTSDDESGGELGQSQSDSDTDSDNEEPLLEDSGCEIGDQKFFEGSLLVS